MEETKQLTQREIARAATNDPALSDNEFQLGDRTFKVVDLPYDDYVKFLGHLQPLLEAITSRVTGFQGDYDEADLNVTTLLKYCAEALPHMVQLIVKQTDATVTVDDVKKLGRSPFKLASAVVKQIEQNRVISDIADFFAQMLPLFRAAKGAMTTATSMTKETP